MDSRKQLGNSLADILCLNRSSKNLETTAHSDFCLHMEALPGPEELKQDGLETDVSSLQCHLRSVTENIKVGVRQSSEH